MSDFEVSNDYKLQTLQQRLENLNVEGWHNEEALLVARAIGNLEEADRLAGNITIIKTAIEGIKAKITELSA